MNKTFALQHPAEQPRDPHTLGTLAASLVACTHPEQSRLRAPGSCDATAPIWCAACGALCFGEGPASRWQAAALPSLLTKKHFEEVVLLLHAIHQLTLLARSQPLPGAAGSPAHIFLRNVRSSLGALSRLPLVEGVDRLEAAIAEMPPSVVHP